MTILVTGAAGFIGSNFVLDWLSQSTEEVVSLDLLTYAGNLENLSSLNQNPHHHFVKGNIGDRDLVLSLLKNMTSELSFILRRRVMWIDPFMDQGTLSKPISSALIICWNPSELLE
jgi:dTDP-D-glucose 4,6-dehydratase